jgi:hypothetical protein
MNPNLTLQTICEPLINVNEKNWQVAEEFEKDGFCAPNEKLWGTK